MKLGGKVITFSAVSARVSKFKRTGYRVVMKVTREQGNIYVIAKNGNVEAESFKLGDISVSMREKVLKLSDTWGYA